MKGEEPVSLLRGKRPSVSMHCQAHECRLNFGKVTGAAQGIGLVCARALLEHGLSKLAIFDVDEVCMHRALQHFHSLDKRYQDDVIVRKVNVVDETAVNENIEHISRMFDGIDILLCFAGITDSKLALEYPIDSWKKIFDVNLHGTFLTARATAR